ncbi:MAG TPA: helix-turn-helix domain-containing protein [Streptosporangiaceae bacterium]|jgi:AcrR family transcriptional regulator|nr:helix-turn-helix domain-containing protein [Streptosporangiaceae bacterium]
MDQDTPAQPRWRETQRRALQDQIADAALVVFAEHGYAAGTYDQIAARAGVARRTVANHFPRKRDMLDFWSRRRRSALAALDGQESTRESSAAETLSHLMARLAEINENEPDLARVLVSGSLTEYGSVTESFPVFDAFRDAVERGIAREELRADYSPQLVAEILMTCYTDTLQRWLAPASGPARDELAPRLRAKLDIILTGIATSHPSPGAACE